MVSKPVTTEAVERRRMAEIRVGERQAAGELVMDEIDSQTLLHELRGHQVELELQNEVLLQSEADAPYPPVGTGREYSHPGDDRQCLQRRPRALPGGRHERLHRQAGRSWSAFRNPSEMAAGPGKRCFPRAGRGSELKQAQAQAKTGLALVVIEQGFAVAGE